MTMDVKRVGRGREDSEMVPEQQAGLLQASARDTLTI